MTAFIQREIARARTFTGSVRCRDARGRPIAGATISLYQVAGAFDLGAAWAGEPLAALQPFARLGTDLLVPHPAPPCLLEACAALALRAMLAVPAPERSESLQKWRERRLPERRVVSDDLSAVRSWALDLGLRAETPGPPGGPDPLLADALDALGQQTGQPVALVGLRLPLCEPPATAACYGISLDTPGTSGHLAELRRLLSQAAEGLGACFVHGLRAPRPDPQRRPRSWALGGAERFEAEAMAARLTLCFSVPGVTGVFCDRLADPSPRGDEGGLLAADLRPKRAYKLLRGLLQHEWRTRAHGTTDDDGQFTWRGYHGAYELTVTLPDGRVRRAERTFTAADALAVWEVQVPDAP
jgi:hypothetical protein